jgi:prepilin-type N-terminal cleavage/methylation domain-containing protein
MTRIKTSQGFTLLELLASTVVFSFAMLALYRLQAGSLQGNSFANEVTRATILAQDKMEILMGRPYLDPLLNDTNNDGTDQDDDADGVDDAGKDFGLNNTVISISGTPTVNSDGIATSDKYTIYHNIAVDQPLPHNKTIRVIVTWQGNRNITHRAVLTSIKADTT